MSISLKIIFSWTTITMTLLSCSQAEHQKILPGAYQLEEYIPFLEGKKVGFYGNHTSLIESTHTIDSLLALQINITTVFSPEHGIKGNAADGEIIELQAHNYDFELFSLYGKTKKPTTSQLANVDILLVDIQDVGVRFYTYSATLTYLMDQCAIMGIPVMILDRPNPNGSYVDGPVLDDCCYSIVGMHPIPVVYGMTLGELAWMINDELWLESKKKVELTIIPVKKWTHNSRYSLPVRPSPNLPNDLSVALYPSLALFEGSQVSLGRGTDSQFQIVGHPLIADSAFHFTPMPNHGSKYPKLEGEKCFGESFTGNQPIYKFDISIFIKYYTLLRPTLGDDFFIHYLSNLIGNPNFREQLKQQLPESDIRQSWEPQLTKFKKLRQKYLLYP
jgi:uncharacterized protein YbbC (DUF1343 family)